LAAVDWAGIETDEANARSPETTDFAGIPSSLKRRPL
jgi:hypothetical protein